MEEGTGFDDLGEENGCGVVNWEKRLESGALKMSSMTNLMKTVTETCKSVKH